MLWYRSDLCDPLRGCLETIAILPHGTHCRPKKEGERHKDDRHEAEEHREIDHEDPSVVQTFFVL